MAKPSRPHSDPPAVRAFDWTAAHERLAKAEAALMTEATIAPGTERDVLRRRAAALAVPNATAASGEVVALVGFAVGGERYAISIEHVQEVVDSPVLLTVPGAPDLLQGVFNYRGAVVAAIRLARLLGGDGEETGRFMIVVAVEEAWVGIPADEIMGIVQLPTADIQPMAVGPGNESHPSIRGIAQDSWVVLDAAYVVGDSRLVVDEEVPMAIPGGKGEGNAT